MTTQTYDEHAAVRRVFRRAIEAGYSISVFDGDEWAVSKSINLHDACEATTGMDECKASFWRPDPEHKWRRVGTMLLVFGNGEPPFADYTDNAEMAALIDPEMEA